MTRPHLIRVLAAILLLALFGIVRMPLEHRLEQKLQAAHFRAPKLNIGMRDQLGQSMTVAAIGGFRSLIATWQNIQAFTSFERADWADVEERFQLITQLQPRVKDHWISAKWHMAYNAYAYYNFRAEEAESDWQRWQLKNVVADGYLERGKQFLLDGMRYLPDEADLYRDMGDLYAAPDKYDNPCEAVDWYYQGMQKPDAHRALRALYLSSLSRCPERAGEAYEAFLEAYHEGYRTPTVRVNVERFEDAEADALVAGSSLDELRRAAAGRGDAYLPLAALARYWTTVEKDPEKAAAVFRELAAIEGIPDHYVKKLGLELAAIPGREREAIEILAPLYQPRLPGLYPDVRRAIIEIEDRLRVPEPGRLIPEAQRRSPDAIW